MVDLDDEPVLVGVDGTDSSIRAAAWAVGFAKNQSKRLICVYVHTPVPAFTASSAEGMREAHQETADQLRAIVAQRSEDIGLEVLFVERSGSTRVELARAAEDYRAAAIVVGASISVTHRLGGWVGAALARHAICPVVIVP